MLDSELRHLESTKRISDSYTAHVAAILPDNERDRFLASPESFRSEEMLFRGIPKLNMEDGYLHPQAGEYGQSAVFMTDSPYVAYGYSPSYIIIYNIRNIDTVDENGFLEPSNDIYQRITSCLKAKGVSSFEVEKDIDLKLRRSNGAHYFLCRKPQRIEKCAAVLELDTDKSSYFRVR